MDHPRGCGEHVETDLSYVLREGSSPRMRGAPRGTRSNGAPRPKGDHPRGCGEHGVSPDELDSDEGSSPRMRGALSSVGAFCPVSRIIPADAGSTPQSVSLLRNRGDHPRGCGEHLGMTGSSKDVTGSSPRMRGARGRHPREASGLRIIPADAGSTRQPPPEVHTPEDHPRGCGEHTLGHPSSTASVGSSPRMREALG